MWWVRLAGLAVLGAVFGLVYIGTAPSWTEAKYLRISRNSNISEAERMGKKWEDALPEGSHLLWGNVQTIPNS